MSEDSSNSSGGGNTKTPPKQISPALKWCLTLHHYTEMEISSIKQDIRETCRFGILAKEFGKSGDTPHIQGYIEFKTKKRPKSVFMNQTIHWEKAKGTKEQNVSYCKKEKGEIWVYPEEYTINIELYEWQKDLKILLDSIPDDRSIYWVWETRGRTGKTTFQKWVYLNYDNVVVLSGKCEDMKNGIVQYELKNSCLPKIVLVNIPRVNNNHVSISGLEQIKDMFFFCGKYEGGMICGANPHVIVFANEPPDETKMSEDRWKIRCIGEGLPEIESESE